MKRKDKILIQAQLQFNEQGISAVSLKAIAKAMKISYGNVTYHFANKAQLVGQLYANMLTEHQQISMAFGAQKNLLEAIILAPNDTFEISFRYRFLFIDFATIIRQYPDIHQQQQQLTATRMEALAPIFDLLKQQGYFRTEIPPSQIQHLMQISGAIRTFFFMHHYTEIEQTKNLEDIKRSYLLYVNQLLYPYLTPSGIQVYKEVLNLE
ncbi:TetR/AcrR family transcriptional regulator [Aureispira anguillae]|uniref:TetR/AcrR family transcriptional regulator n=1 Tax=Aureispira anguillae TaxID=2864201 RepID=A0A915YFL3_9BACT|nr:TetR/AcrR family transcriptional regulator [Aureispira anguillae]BDS12242.1 TetR/AcrR family transcriptional regulator [Aureispira anguillae]